MKKNKVFIFFLIFTIVLFFSSAALIDQCSMFSGSDTDEEGVEEVEKESIEKETELEEDVIEETSEEEPLEEENNKDIDSKETSDKEIGDTEDKEESKHEEPELKAPTIDLQIYEGPTYSADDGVCYFRIEAVTTGKPAPTVVFSKDDSNGAWGPYKTQINLYNPSDTYILNATATNSVDTATDSIELSWGCNPATKGGNRNPIVTHIDLTGGTPLYWTDSKYDINAVAEDPDGDSLTYYWSVSGGTFDDIYANPTVWNTPGAGGTYYITVSVNDGNGGIASETIDVFISQTSYPAIFTEEFPIVTSEGFMIDIDKSQAGTGTIPPIITPYGVGDTGDNKSRKAYISFDISGLNGDIISSHLTFSLSSQVGDPTPFLPLRVKAMYWGERRFDGTPPLYGFEEICRVNNPNFSADNGNLKLELLRAIEEGRNRFQIEVLFIGPTPYDNDNSADLWIYDLDDISLTVNYQP